MNNNLQDAINAIALSKIGDIPDGARDLLLAGHVYQVDTTVRVCGTLSVGVDYESTPTVSIPLKETLALFIAYSGITAEHACNTLVRAMNDALAKNNGKGQGQLAEMLPVVNTTLARVQNDVLNRLSKVPRKGPVSAELNVTPLGELVPS